MANAFPGRASRRPSLYRLALAAGFLGLNAIFWYLAVKAIAFVGLLATL